MANPAITLRFDVRVDGVDLGSFTSCDGLTAEYEVFEYEEGGLNGYVHRLPGRLKFQNIKLTRPIDEKSTQLASWFSRMQQQVTRSTATIIAYDSYGTMISQWSLADVYPARWTGPTLSAEGTEIAKETLELAHNGFLAGV